MDSKSPVYASVADSTQQKGVIQVLAKKLERIPKKGDALFNIMRIVSA